MTSPKYSLKAAEKVIERLGTLFQRPRHSRLEGVVLQEAQPLIVPWLNDLINKRMIFWPVSVAQLPSPVLFSADKLKRNGFFDAFLEGEGLIEGSGMEYFLAIQLCRDNTVMLMFRGEAGDYDGAVSVKDENKPFVIINIRNYFKPFVKELAEFYE